MYLSICISCLQLYSYRLVFLCVAHNIDTISDEIEDLSEHDIIADLLLSVEDIDWNIEDVNALWSSFHRKHKELKTFVNDYKDS